MERVAVMETTVRRLSRGQVEQLQGYVACGPAIFRGGLFLAAIGALAWVLRSVHAALARRVPWLSHDAWWVVPLAVLACALYLAASRWTGGRAFRSKVRVDLAQGVAAVRQIKVVEVIEVEEREDEGRAYFLRTEDGETILFAGQYLENYRRRGFPWRTFEIVEAPESRTFLDMVPNGDHLEPSFRRPPFTWEERKGLGGVNENYVFLDADFEALKKIGSTQ
jgi:hypothetical protein